MTYATKDKSVSDGAPIEVYKFSGPFGTYRYTSNNEAVTVDGEEYLPRPITRTSIEVGSIIDTLQTMDFVIPHDDPVAQIYAYLISPKELEVEVKRVHSGDNFATDFKVEWLGEGLTTSSSGKWTTISTGTLLQSRLGGNMSSVYYQGLCNHALYDDLCKADRDTFTSDATITKIQGQIITVDNDDVANGVLNAGEMTNTRTGEKRTIIDNTNNVIRISYPFIDVVKGDTVELTQGCNHLRLGHCKTRFNNVVNYGGFDFVPLKNPFEA